MNLRKPVNPDAKRPNASYLAHPKVLSMFSKVSWRCFSWPLCDFLSLARWSWGGRVRAALLAQGWKSTGTCVSFVVSSSVWRRYFNRRPTAFNFSAAAQDMHQTQSERVGTLHGGQPRWRRLLSCWRRAGRRKVRSFQRCVSSAHQRVERVGCCSSCSFLLPGFELCWQLSVAACRQKGVGRQVVGHLMVYTWQRQKVDAAGPRVLSVQSWCEVKPGAV